MEKIRNTGGTIKGFLLAGFIASLWLNWALWNNVIYPKHHLNINEQQYGESLE